MLKRIPSDDDYRPQHLVITVFLVNCGEIRRRWTSERARRALTTTLGRVDRTRMTFLGMYRKTLCFCEKCLAAGRFCGPRRLRGRQHSVLPVAGATAAVVRTGRRVLLCRNGGGREELEALARV
jgi:hypothetical protein